MGSVCVGVHVCVCFTSLYLVYIPNVNMKTSHKHFKM